MSKEAQIESGIEAVKTLLRRHGKKGHRIHMEAAEDNMNRLRALEGICGKCKNINVEIIPRDGKKTATIRCKKGHSPLNLYYDTPLGETPNCQDYTPR